MQEFRDRPLIPHFHKVNYVEFPDSRAGFIGGAADSLKGWNLNDTPFRPTRYPDPSPTTTDILCIANDMYAAFMIFDDGTMMDARRR